MWHHLNLWYKPMSFYYAKKYLHDFKKILTQVNKTNRWYFMNQNGLSFKSSFVNEPIEVKGKHVDGGPSIE